MNNGFKAKDYRVVLSSYKDHKCVICGKTITKGSSYITRHCKIKNYYYIGKDLHINENIHLSCLENEVKGVVKVENKRIIELKKDLQRELSKRKFYSEKIQEIQECIQTSNKRINLIELQIFEIENDFKEALRSELMDKLKQAHNLNMYIEKLKEKLNENN